MSERRLDWGRVLLWVTAVLAGALAYFSPVANTNSDPQLGLLVSQVMVRYQTVQMDVYRETFAPILDRAFVVINDHIYYYFPMGTPIFSAPIVGAANLLGLDMADPVQEAATQNFISAALVALSFLVLYRVCRCFLPAGAALFLTATTFLGSALISTVSTALWSIDFAVLFIALSLLALSKLSLGERRRFYPYLLGFCLFGAYLCRPSTFLFVALVLGYLLAVDRRTFWRTAGFSFVLLAGFLVFIRVGYGSWLPPYYNDFGRLAVERRPLYEAYFGNLISPSRGLLIYSPIFLLTLAGAVYYFRRLKRKPLYWLMLAWFLLHLLLVARTTRWWGGLSFGPRILTELLPGLVLLTALVGAVFLERTDQRRLRIAVVGAYGALALWAVFLNSYQALFNPYTAWWHSALAPNIDYAPDYLWRWDYAQFLANNDLVCQRDREYMESVMGEAQLARKLYPYMPGRPLEIVDIDPFLLYEILNGAEETAVAKGVQPDASDTSETYLPTILHEGEKTLSVLLSGWSPPQFGYRWSMCETATMAFMLDYRVDANRPHELSLQSGSFGEQRVNVRLNGVDLGQIVFNGRATPPVSHSIGIPPGALIPGEVNQVVLDLPDSVIPDLPRENRRVGLSMVSFEINSSR